MILGKVYKNLLRGTYAFVLNGETYEVLNENDAFVYLGETTNECPSPKILYKGKVYYVLPHRIIRVFEVT